MSIHPFPPPDMLNQDSNNSEKDSSSIQKKKLPISVSEQPHRLPQKKISNTLLSIRKAYQKKKSANSIQSAHQSNSGYQRSKTLNKKRTSVTAMFPASKLSHKNMLFNNEKKFDCKKKRCSIVLPRRPTNFEQQLSAERTSQSKAQFFKSNENNTFSIGNRDIENYITNSQFAQPFQQIWGLTILACNTFNFIIFFYYMGIPETPSGIALAVEIMSEFLMMIDFFLRFFLSSCLNDIWEKMWLLQEKHGKKLYNIILKAIASFPQQFLFQCLGFSHSALSTITIAILRGLKLLRIYQIPIYFSKQIIAFKRRKFAHLKTFQVVFNLILAANLIGAAWLIIYRIEPKDEETWYSSVNMDLATNIEKYVDSIFYVVATMTGLGYGDVIPITHYERVVCILVMFTGATIFADFFARFAVSIYNSNEKTIENRKKLEQAKEFANQRNLPAEFKNKIMNYYTFIRLKYGKLEQRYEILHELPISLRTELALFINVDLIQKVKLFQLSDPAFIMAVTRFLKPKICLAGDFVIRKGEIAYDLYFIKKGIVKVLCCDDEKTVIAYLDEGCYFGSLKSRNILIGEIGLLISEKRSTSVKAHTNCIFYTIDRENLIQILESFHSQKRFLRAVGKQRLQTTSIQDLGDEDQILEMESSQEADESQFVEESLDDDLKVKNLKPWLTKRYRDFKECIIIPGSTVYIVWSILIVLAVVWIMLYVPFSIAYEKDATELGITFSIDILTICIFFFDIFFNIHVPIKKEIEEKFDLDKTEIMLNYFNKYLFFDFIGFFPFDYLLWPFSFDQQVLAFLRLFRIVKFYRAFQILETMRATSNKKIPPFTLLLLSFLFIYCSHIFGCIYFYIGRQEYGEDRRFDGQTWFANLIDRTFVNFEPMINQSTFDQYVHSTYLACCTMGTVMYGEIIPFAMSERVYSFFVMFSAKIFLAFLYAEAASYISSKHSGYSSYINRRESMMKWLIINRIPKPLVGRVLRYQDMLWKKFKGLDEQSILKDLPQTLKEQTTYYLFQGFLNRLVENIDLFPSNEPGGISTLTKKLKLVILPKGESIINQGELASEMFFILQGKVEVVLDDGTVLTTLGEGKYIGEMALFGSGPSLRSANIVCLTDVSVAFLSKDDFNLICESYPSFKYKIEEVIEKRKEDNKKKQEQEEIKKSLEDETQNQPLKDTELKEKEETKPVTETDNPIHLQKKETKNKTLFYKKIQDWSNTPKQSSIKIDSESDSENIAQAKIGIIRKESEINKKDETNKICKTTQFNTLVTDRSVDPNYKYSGIGKFCSFWKNCFAKICKIVNLNLLRKFILFSICLYNFIFIPLQIAFRISYTAPFFILEVITFGIYGFELGHHIQEFKIIKMKVQSKLLSRMDERIRVSAEKKKRRKMIFKIIVEIISLFPIALIFEHAEIYHPAYLIAGLKMLRLLKIWPVNDFFFILKKIHMNGFRILEVILTYYIVTHILTCLFILMQYFEENINDTWIKRIPYPFPEMVGFRLGNDQSNVTDYDKYNHALYWGVNTVSHVAIGDVTPVTVKERIYTAFSILCGTFCYAFLFGNIASLVTDFAQGLFHNFQKKYQNLMAKIPLENLLPAHVYSIKEYFDYEWATVKGMDESFLKELPDCLASDIQMSRYKEFVERCFLFRDENSRYYNIRIAASLFKLMEIRTYMKNDFIVKAGALSGKSFFILDGELVVVGINNKKLGTIKTGGLYSDELHDKPLGRRLVHIVSRRISTIGILPYDKLLLFAKAYGLTEKKLYFANEYIYNKSYIAFEEYLTSQNLKTDLLSCSEALERHYTFSTSESYKEIIKIVNYENLSNSDGAVCFAQETDLYRTIERAFELENNIKSKKPRFKKTSRSLIKIPSNFQKDNLGPTFSSFYSNNCLKNMYISPYSRFFTILNSIHLCFIIYSSIGVPLQVAFGLQMIEGTLFMEIVCILETLIFIFLNFRTVVVSKGGISIKFEEIWENYKENGFYLDLLGISPFNLIFGCLNLKEPWIIIMPLRLLRLAMVAKLPKIASQLERAKRGFDLWIQVLKSAISFFFLWHWTACLWYFVNKQIEGDSVYTWIQYHELNDEPLRVQYLMAIYYVINIVTSVGYGDMFPMTNIERAFTCILINTGDALFAVVFGLIAAMSLTSRNSTMDRFFDKMNDVTDFIESFKIDESQRKRIEQYFAYVWNSQQRPNPSLFKDLVHYLPVYLAREVAYESIKDLLNPMFSVFKSENFMRQLVHVLETSFFLPGDYIIFKDDIGEEMYFIAEGTVVIIASDKHTVLNKLSKNQYFGEIAIFLNNNKRICYVQAETFCTLGVLRKKDLDKIAITFPYVANEMKKEGERRMQATAQKEEENKSNSDSQTDQDSSGSELIEKPKNFDILHDFSSPVPAKRRESRRPSQLSHFSKARPSILINRGSIYSGEFMSPPLPPIRTHKIPTLSEQLGYNHHHFPKVASVQNLVHTQNNSRLGIRPTDNSLLRASFASHQEVPNQEKTIPGSVIPRKSLLFKIHKEEMESIISRNPFEPLSHKTEQNSASEIGDLFIGDKYLGQQLVVEESLDKKNITIKTRRDKKGKRQTERRLSRLTLGKQLTLSQTAGLELQWTIQFQRVDK